MLLAVQHKYTNLCNLCYLKKKINVCRITAENSSDNPDVISHLWLLFSNTTCRERTLNVKVHEDFKSLFDLKCCSCTLLYYLSFRRNPKRSKNDNFCFLLFVMQHNHLVKSAAGSVCWPLLSWLQCRFWFHGFADHNWPLMPI